ncbi:uncharacterized protein LOC131060642 isoform X2 [Cryptomeria japonica]|uniref:uncharacterized protein LOC131060642 isoform X2 n=1 Tax=Cryptomeria japonica TaxID=3369 RepID=UPI0025AD9199|nr:uncharacterized protein LOC131060642 isoform X2 [Cryptomeria japonica]
MHRSGPGGLCKLGLRVRAEERQRAEAEGEEDFDKKSQLGCSTEQAVHLIPLLLLACLLILYVFSYTPDEENAGLINYVKEPKPANILIGSKEELLQTFSVYNHRSLHQLKQTQHKVNRNNAMKEKEVKQFFSKGNKLDIRRTRLRKKSFHRKARILNTH